MRILMIIASAALAVVVSTGPASADQRDTRLPTTPCHQEDSHSCVWDAVHMGNGIGHSFWSGKRGHVHYISHATAHRLIYGA